MILSVFLLSFNSIINIHTHRLSSGEVIIHSHPYNHAKEEGAPYKPHRHTKTELLVISMISNPVFLVAFILSLTGVVVSTKKNLCLLLLIGFPTSKYYCSLHYRGPPTY
ncbi:MAG: hypothetical protein KJ607_10485 [Bacteroidetes bacterium]|nr:hypothetical protein [Bacteroidota bacterium]